MAKLQITRVWVVGVITMVAGFIAMGIAVGLMLAFGGHFVAAASGNGSNFIPRTDGFFWTMVSIIIVGGLVAVVGVVAQWVGWIAALVSTYPLQDKTWFIVLLAGGVIGLGFGLAHVAVMVAYIIAGPDRLPSGEPWLPSREPAMPRPTTLAHSG
ncbi:MAG TPA: hypothetical protein VKQ30_05130 [Ktedonobacterales bacterium]|nr:hypothetical protein [Ktedonobacterales bacterium]